MRFTPWCSLLLPLLLAPLAQEAAPDEQEQEEQDGRWFHSGRSRAQRIAEGVIGSWQLVGVKLRGEDLPTGDFTGYVLITEGYMSIEMHVQGFDSLYEDGQFFQTGMHRWRVDRDLLVTSTLIGVHNFTRDENPLFEAPGSRREFKVIIEDKRVTLTRTDGVSQLVLRRLGGLPFPREEVDFYGRELPPEDDEADEDERKD